MTKKLLITFTTSAALLVAAPTLASAAPKCGPRDVVVAALSADYGETRQSIGLGSNNMVLEVFASLASGSWTVTMTTPDGLTCLVASGQAFETLVEALPAHGSKT
ncbi:MAG: hypothetical protein JXR13_10455 [Thalassovita sp.]